MGRIPPWRGCHAIHKTTEGVFILLIMRIKGRLVSLHADLIQSLMQENEKKKANLSHVFKGKCE